MHHKTSVLPLRSCGLLRDALKYNLKVICGVHYVDSKTTDVFDTWFDAQDNATQEKVLAGLLALAQGGPSVGRPLVDTIKGSSFTNLKELRVQHQENRCGPSSLLIRYDKQLCCVPAIRAVTRRGFTKKCCRLLRLNTPGI